MEHVRSRSPVERRRRQDNNNNNTGRRKASERHEVRPNSDISDVDESRRSENGLNDEQDAPVWGRKLLEYPQRGEKRLEELEALVKRKSTAKNIIEEDHIKPAHVFAKKSYEVQTEFNNSVLKNLKEAADSDSMESCVNVLKQGMTLIKQRNKLLVISDKYGREMTGLLTQSDCRRC